MNDRSLQRERAFTGGRIQVDRLTIPLSGGRTAVREMVVHPGAVVILPVLDDGRVVLIRNVRHGLGRALWELPAGTLEPSEDPAVCAGRELIEETGYEGERIEKLLHFYTTPGFCDEKIWCYLATGLTHVGQDLDETEEIHVEPLAADHVFEMIATNEIEDAKTIATLLYWRASAKPE